MLQTATNKFGCFSVAVVRRLLDEPVKEAWRGVQTTAQTLWVRFV